MAINSNEHDSAQTIAEHAKKFGIPFPVLRDEKHLAADRFGAERTPEAFVLDGEFTIRYHGRIDDQYGIGFQRPQPTRRDLVEAASTKCSAGKPVTQAKTAVSGCIITRAAAPKQEATVTYAKEVSRIVQNHCQECHRAGQIGPMPLVTYDDVSQWSGTIREVVKGGRMPPWYADPNHGKFRNDRRLADDERDTLLTWIAQGCPRGDDKDLPAAKKFADGWSIGTPDAVFTMTKEFTVPAKAGPKGIRYQGFVVPTNFTEDVWVQAVEAKPGNRAVVHHMLVYVVGGKRDKDAADFVGGGLLAAEAPGDLAAAFPPGHAKRIPKGATLAFQMHYTPNGTEQTDRSSVALVFAKKPPTHEIKTRAIAQQLLFIPPGAENHRIFASSSFKKDVVVTSLFPHMHLRGKSFEFQAVYADGKREVLLSVPQYDFNWQSNYYLDKPLFLPAGSKIECTAHFDNSKNNRNNPDPSKLVHWGEQTWDEMMIGFVDYTYVETAAKEEKK